MDVGAGFVSVGRAQRTPFERLPPARLDIAPPAERVSGAPGSERQVKQALRKTLLRYRLHQDRALFDRANGYVRQHY